MSDSFFDYDHLVREALKGVVKNVLSEVAKNGLMGDHHFYVAFQTGFPGVQIPDHLREKYPDEMTIVIQHRYWGLRVHKDRFEIGLSFNQKPEHLIIPFEAVVGFVDPSAQFALQFESDEADDTEEFSDDEFVADLNALVSEPSSDNNINEETSSDDKARNKDKSDADKDDDKSGDNVVTLDAFRKK